MQWGGTGQATVGRNWGTLLILCHRLLQSQKLREVFNMDFPDNNFLLKTLTVVSGPDMVDLTFHNFVSYKENVGKVHLGRRACGWAPGVAWASNGTGLGCRGRGHLSAQGSDCHAPGSCRTGLKTCWLWPSTH